MKTVTIELTSPRAQTWLKELEELNIIRVLKTKKTEKVSFSEKFAGVISKESAKKLHKHVEKSRKEWDKNS